MSTVTVHLRAADGAFHDLAVIVPPVASVYPSPPYPVPYPTAPAKGMPDVPHAYYRDLYKAGDTPTAAMARLTTGAMIILPNDGLLTDAGFGQGYLSTHNIPKQATGVWGDGDGSNAGFTVAPNSITPAQLATVPKQGSSQPCQLRVVKQDGGDGVLFGNFRVAGTPQGVSAGLPFGCVFHNFTVSQPNKAGGVIQDVHTSGWRGNSGAPPGEVFGVELHGAVGWTFARIEGDGRRADGMVVGGVPMTMQNCYGGQWFDCYGHHSNGGAGAAVLYESANVRTFDCVWGSKDGTDGPGVDGKAGGFLNHEQTTGCEHYNPTFNLNHRDHNDGVHVTHSNDSLSRTIGGNTFKCDNGSLRIVNPTFTDTWGDGKLYVQSWHPYGNGDTQTTPPTVVDRSGQPLAAYKWVHNTA